MWHNPIGEPIFVVYRVTNGPISSPAFHLSANFRVFEFVVTKVSKSCHTANCAIIDKCNYLSIYVLANIEHFLYQ